MKDAKRSVLRKLAVSLAMIIVAAMMVPCVAFADGNSQKVKSSWTEIMNIYEDYSYHWCIRMTLTVTDGVVTEAITDGMAIGGGDIPPMEKPYYSPYNQYMEAYIEDAQIAASNPSSVDNIDIVSGATHTCTAIKNATKEALEAWNERSLSVQGVVDTIGAIDSAVDKEAAVASARTAYNELSADLKTYVPADVYAILTDAEAAIREAALAVEAQPVIDAISAIVGSFDTKAAVEQARKAYEALPADAKQYVPGEVLTVLTSAEAALEAEAKAAAAEADLANGSIKLAKTSLTYTGKALTPAVTVKSKSGKTLASGTDYTVAYKNNKNAGKATVTVTGKGAYTGSKSATFTIAKAKQTIKAAKTYTVKVKNVKKKAQKLSVKFKASGNGKVTYTAAKTAGGKVSIAKNGKVTVKKGTKKGTYTLKVKVTAAAKGNYDKTTVKNVKLVVKVK